MVRPSAKAWLVAILSFATGTLGDASANYTEQLLSSGTVRLGDWQAAYDKAAAFIDTLTTEEKITLVAGGDAGNFTALNVLDSATNPLTYYYVTTWPAGLAMSMTWDQDVAEAQGNAVGSEFKAKGVNFVNGPTLEPLGRSAWCGRTGETYGLDSYLAGSMAGAVTRGLASAGVIPSAKHFILNEQETNRDGSGGGGGGGGGGAPPTGGNSTLTTRDSNSSTSSSDSSDAYSVQIGDKAFHETYLAPFYDTVKNGMGGAMCAMNRVNGTYSCESQDLLAKYLKVELGFPGLVNADVSAQKTGINAANAGMDLSSSSYFSNETLGAGLNNGSFTEARLNDMVARNLMGYYKMGQDKGFPEHVSSTAHVDVRGNHAALARKYAGESIALLKNTANALPLKELKSVSIFGYHATQRYVGANTALSVYQGEPSTMQGHMTTVGGSAMGSLAYLVSPVQRFVDRAVKEGFMLRWWLNDTVSTSSSGGMMGSGTELSETTTGVAENSDACVVFLNSWGGEGGDRSELYNADQDHLVSTVADNCNNTIVVVNTVGPRLVDAWIAHDNVTGVLYAGPLGQESASAIDDVLFGAVNPSGRLVHTIARNESDYNQDTVITEDLELDFADGNYIDYKYFDKYNVTPRYEFGYGLSYTTFEYASTVSVRANNNIKSGHATSPRAVGGREDLWDDVATVHTTVRNTGRMAGAEVAQLYVSFPDAADEPVRQLRGYQKVTIQPGKEADVSFTLRRRDLSVWDVARQEWEVVKGDYKVYIGASSRDLKSSTVLSIV